MAPTPSLKVVKTLPRRGGTVVWSNRYHFSGGTPADLAHWTALADAVTDQEQLCYGAAVEIIQAVCYEAGSDLPLHTITYSKTGSMSMTGGIDAPSDAVLIARYTTDQRSTKNHPIYLFNYHHGAVISTSAGGDIPLALQRTRLGEFADGWVAGYSDGVHTYERAGPNGAVAQSDVIDTYITHRDFPT